MSLLHGQAKINVFLLASRSYARSSNCRVKFATDYAWLDGSMMQFSLLYSDSVCEKLCFARITSKKHARAEQPVSGDTKLSIPSDACHQEAGERAMLMHIESIRVRSSCLAPCRWSPCLIKPV